jgi:hypothetical protein
LLELFNPVAAEQKFQSDMANVLAKKQAYIEMIRASCAAEAQKTKTSIIPRLFSGDLSVLLQRETWSTC